MLSLLAAQQESCHTESDRTELTVWLKKSYQSTNTDERFFEIDDYFKLPVLQETARILAPAYTLACSAADQSLPLHISVYKI